MQFYTNVSIAKNDILFRGYVNGKKISKKVAYKPHFYVPSKNKNSEWKTINGFPVERMDFDSIKDASQFFYSYNDTAGFNIYGTEKFVYAFIAEAFPNEISYNTSDIAVLYLDIEVSSEGGFADIDLANKEVIAISIKCKDRIIALGLKDYEPSNPKVEYYKFTDEEALLRNFIRFWKELDPDIVSGYNVERFDIPYLINRINRVLSEADARSLSPWGILQDRMVEIMGRENKVYYPIGISILDYFDLYQKFAYIRAGQDAFKESKKLDYIANKELNERKLDYSKYRSLQEMYEKDHQMFMDYNIHDTLLVAKLEDKLKYIELVLAVAYDAKVNYQDALTTVLLWDVIIYNYLLTKKIVIPKNAKKEGRKLDGAYCKSPQLGLHSWILSFDLTSLYPHLLIQYNISPETFVGKNKMISIDDIIAGKIQKTEGVSTAANGCKYTNEKVGFIPALMERQFALRAEFRAKLKEAKKAKDEALASRYNSAQLAKKIQLNSLYGALGNAGFRYYDINHAEAVTLSGQLSIRWAEHKLNEYLNKLMKTKDKDYVIASDTDSLYIDLSSFVSTIMPNETDKNKIANFLNEIANKKIEPKLEQWYSELADYMGARKQAMKMKREVIAESGVWQAKKRYALSVLDSEGERYDEPKLKIMGLEAVRSSTPEICRKAIIEAIKIILNREQDKFQKFVEEFKKEYYTKSFEEIACPRGVSNLEKWQSASSIYKKSTPIQVKGALIFNEMRRRLKLDSLPPIYSGEKIKFAKLLTPNPYNNESVIALAGEPPPELEVHKYIDYSQMFLDTFLSPLESIVGKIGWTTSTHDTLEGLYD